MMTNFQAGEGQVQMRRPHGFAGGERLGWWLTLIPMESGPT